MGGQRLRLKNIGGKTTKNFHPKKKFKPPTLRFWGK
jgi:hypothetical protein